MWREFMKYAYLAPGTDQKFAVVNAVPNVWLP
jgi:hypothetical protein